MCRRGACKRLFLLQLSRIEGEAGVSADVPPPPDLTLFDGNQNPPLKSLHPDSSLIRLKLAGMEQKSTEELIRSLMPGQKDCLKARKDGTVLDGHHRLSIPMERNEDIHSFPREIIERQEHES